MRTGLASVTFRDKTTDEVIALAASARLDGIEWGGDTHVPPVAGSNALHVQAQCADHGLRVLSYGSYFNCDDARGFPPILETAQLLGAPVIRVWAGKKSPDLLSTSGRARLYGTLKACVSAAQAAGIQVATEYHRHSATETLASALDMLATVPGLRTYWQPNPDIPLARQLEELQALRMRLAHLHVFAWAAGNVQHPLAMGIPAWRQYLESVGEMDDSHAAILEFVKGGTAVQFMRDAATLREDILG